MPNSLAKITFRVKAPLIHKPDKQIYITGDHEALGNWFPDRVPLQNVGRGVWQLDFEFPKQTSLAFKFSRGSWETEEVVKNGEVCGNRVHRVQENQVIDIKINGWRDILFKARKGIVGSVKYHEDFASAFLRRKRTLVVWLPPSYTADCDQRYPVLYAHDGQNLFDPATAFAGVDWRLDETATRLMKQGKMQETIIVGLYNTRARLQEYADTKFGRSYMRHILEEVKPFIDTTYRTHPGREHTGVMGSSMGGLISLYLIWRHSNVFSKAACLSTSLSWQKRAVLQMIEQDPDPPRDIKIYFDHGGLGDEGAHACDYHHLREIFLRQGYKPHREFHYYFDKNGDHSERSWARRARRPLLFLFRE